MKRLRTFLFRLTVLLLLCGMTAQAQEREQRTVRIPCGMNDFLYLDENGNAAGFCAEYLDELARLNNWKYEYVETDWAAAMEMLEDGRIDILFPTSYLEEREETMDFSSVIGGYMASGLFAREDSHYDYENYEEFDGVRVMLTSGSSNCVEMDALAKKHHFTYEPVYINSLEDKLKALNRGVADMLMFSASNQVDGVKLVAMSDPSPFYYTVKKGNSELLSELNQGMTDLLIDDPDLVSETMSSCITGKNTAKVAFTAKEREFIAKGEPVTVGFYQNSEPLAYEDKDGNAKGIYAQIMNRIKETTGINIVLRPISRDEYWQDLLKDGTLDFYIGSASNINSQDTSFAVTRSFMSYESILITRSNYVVGHSRQARLALTKARSYWEGHLPANLSGAEIQYYRTAKDCLIAVKNGDADMTLVNTIEFNYQSKNVRFSDLVQWENFRFTSTASMSAAKDVDPVMFSAMNRALKMLTSTEINDIINENLNMPYVTASFTDSLYGARYVLLILLILAVVCGIAGIIIHLLRRKQMESLRKQRDIISSLGKFYFITLLGDLQSDSLEKIDAPKTAKDLLNLSENSLSKTLKLVLADSVQEPFQKRMQEFLNLSTLSRRMKENLILSQEYIDNHFGWCRFNLIPIETDNDGEVRHILLAIQRIEEEKQKELEIQEAMKEAFEAANRANAAKSDFLSRMSHDIRTPMNAIIGMTAIAGAHIDDRERVLDALGKITSSSRYLLSLINEVLDMSKIESGKINLNEEEFSLSELLNNLLLMVQPQIRQHNHKLQVHIHNIDHEDVIGDPLRVQQVFLNIMSNAIKYTPDNGIICLTVRELPCSKRLYGCYEFIVEDNGIGMSEKYLQHLFEPFSRAEDVRINKIQGTGLGMAIAQTITRMMNGDIQVESEVGKGSKFTVTIYLKLQDVHEIHLQDLEGVSCLVADDDPISCETTCEILEEIGISGEWVHSGPEAVARTVQRHQEKKDFYAVILDWQMPDMDGVETARAIRQAAGPEIPVIILSAYDWSEIEPEAKAAGVDAFLSKPVFKSGLARLFKNLQSGSQEQMHAQELEQVNERDYSGKRVLLVEDNELNREIAMEILQMTGMHVDHAENGRDAVDLFTASSQGYYDMILMDVQMPILNGYEATVAIRALNRPDAAHVPIVAMTANAFAEDIQASFSFGMNAHLAKPLDFEKLVHILDKYL